MYLVGINLRRYIVFVPQFTSTKNTPKYEKNKIKVMSKIYMIAFLDAKYIK